MQLTGLHHITAICSDLEQTIAFYRDVLGLAIVRDGAVRRRPRDAPRLVRRRRRHAGAARERSWSTRSCPGRGRASGRRTTSRFAVDSAEELDAWRDYLREQDVECSEVFDRGRFRSLYVRDPDGHIVEIATRSPGLWSGPASVASQLLSATRL